MGSTVFRGAETRGVVLRLARAQPGVGLVAPFSDNPRVHASVNEGFLDEILACFYVKVDLDLEVVSPSALGNLDTISTSPLYLTVSALRQPSEVWNNFTIFYVKVNSDPEVHDFIELVRRLAAMGFCRFKLHFSDSVRSGVESRLAAHFFGSPRWPTVVGCQGLGGDGDARSSVPGVLLPEFAACVQ